MYYELWDVETRNLVGEYDTEVEALAFVREVVSVVGEEAASRFALGGQDREGGGAAIADGAELVQRALRVET